jgi:alkane 1-monooxygenase
MWRDAKYLIAYTAPLAAFLGIYFGGIWSPGSVYVGFVLIPLLEFVLPGRQENYSNDMEEKLQRQRFFDWLLYLNIPILYGLIAYYLFTLLHRELSFAEITGMTFSVGLIIATCGINVGHELGHRSASYERFMAKMLLLPALYMHFYIEHNRGHHKNVATDEDPASARRGEWLYTFWWRSVTGAYRNAWRLEKKRMEKQGDSFLSWKNEMIRFQVIQLGYLLLMGLVFGWALLPYVIAIAVFGFLMLESVNYIEHYGLRRKQLPNGRYEKVGPRHSWNSNHELGRIFLYELTRHSDHHYKASRKYQILRHYDESPQLPLGYPVSILMSLTPPLWFRYMDQRIQAFNSGRENN